MNSFEFGYDLDEQQRIDKEWNEAIRKFYQQKLEDYEKE